MANQTKRRRTPILHAFRCKDCGGKIIVNEAGEYICEDCAGIHQPHELHEHLFSASLITGIDVCCCGSYRQNGFIHESFRAQQS